MWLLLNSSEAADYDPAIQCNSCEEWNAPQTPFPLSANTWYVGVKGLSSVLISTEDGLLLLDGGLPQSAELIENNLRQLGFRIEDVRFIATSHAHYDHVGGVSALQRHSGAVVLASPAAAAALRTGGPLPDDPQYGLSEMGFPAVSNVREVADGEVVRLGGVAVTAQHTPGHTPGGTSWTWQTCQAGTCIDLVYADSLNPVSDDTYRFSEGMDRILEGSIGRIRRLPCDLLVPVHPDFSNSDPTEKLAPDQNPFANSGACRAYAATAQARLKRRLKDERSR